jgi:hypothetical protein
MVGVAPLSGSPGLGGGSVPLVSLVPEIKGRGAGGVLDRPTPWGIKLEAKCAAQGDSSCGQQPAPILADIDVELDTATVKLRDGADSLRLIEVFHDNKPEYSSDSRVWEGGVVLARCLREELPASPHASLLRDDLVGTDCQKAPDPGCPGTGGSVAIDLGSGTGVVGLAVARLGLANNVFLTDLDAVVPLLVKNAEMNADGRFGVFGHGSTDSDIARQLGTAETPVSVHVQALDWREASDGSGCRFAVTRALSQFNQQASASALVASEGQDAPCPFERITVFAADCVYSPLEIEPLIGVLSGLVDDFRRIPSVCAFEIILTVKMRLYSETNRSACVKFFAELGRWIYGYLEAEAIARRRHLDTAEPENEPVWSSPDRILEVMKAGNSADDLALRCGLSAESNGSGRQGLALKDVKWKHRRDLVGDLKEKRTCDIAIFRISGHVDRPASPQNSTN